MPEIARFTKKKTRGLKNLFFWCGTCFATGVTQVGRTANAMNCWKKEKQFQWILSQMTKNFDNRIIETNQKQLTGMTEIKEKTEQEFADYLKENGPSVLGEVLKALKLSYSNGKRHINNMLTKGVVKQNASMLQLEPNSDPK